MDINKKIDVWKKKLLDTGKKNRLVNYRYSLTSTIEIANENLEDIFNDLLSGKEFQFAPLFQVVDDFDIEEDIKKSVVEVNGNFYPRKDRYSVLEIRDIIPHFKGKRSVNYLYSTTITNLEGRCLNNLKRKSNLFYEETGVNALYIGYGLLEYKNIADNQISFAPLVLLPVKLVQKNIKDPIKLSAIDEDYVLNETLIHKLLTEYKIDLRQDPSTMFFEEYLEFVDNKLRKYKTTIHKQMVLSLFSFTKIKMYTDLNDNKSLIAENPLIRALCGEKTKSSDKTVEEEPKINESFRILDADSSQEAAIEYAKEGHSFVLQGPPGTGKSQTITNIIAQLIALDKRVLFVCEKKAAIEVVYRNLKKQNLDSFALALHDPKSNKKDIVKDLETNLYGIQNNRTTLNKKALEIYEKNEISEKRLINYAKAIHTPIMPLNKTIFEVYNSLKELDDIKNYDFNIEGFNSFDYKKLDDYLNILKSLDEASLNLGTDVLAHPFFGYNIANFSLRDNPKLLKTLNELLNSLAEVKEIIEILASNGYKDIRHTSELSLNLDYLRIISSLKILPLKYYSYTNNQENLQELLILKGKIKELSSLKATILKVYNLEFLDISAADFIRTLKVEHGSIFRMFSSKYKQIQKDIQFYKQNYKKPRYKGIIRYLSLVDEYQKKSLDVRNEEVYFKEYFGEYYSGINTNFKELETVLEFLINYEKSLNSIKEDFNHEVFIENIINDADYLAEFTNYKNILDKKNKSFEVALKKYLEYFDSYEEVLEDLFFKTKEKIEKISELNNYVTFMSLVKRIEETQGEFAGRLISINTNNYSKIFLKRFYVLWLNEIIAVDEVLADFNVYHHNNSLNDYCDTKRKIQELSRLRVAQLVTESWPQLDSIMAENSEVQVLLAEANKKRKFKPLRILFAQIPNILTDLKPVFMMSPLSVSTFIDPNIYKFDTIIFDEASQVTSENAIGSIYRSKQMIVVGDSEQLPPTSFFNSDMTDEEDDTYDVYESILDEAQTVFPRVMLKWHYRSKDESLITFSNQEIYRSLVTFPGSKVDKETLGVRYEYVDNAVYEKGTGRVNKSEAARVVELIVKHIKNTPSRSLGVVTFNQNQQLLIEQLINNERRRNSDIEDFFIEDKLDNFFIKNLETVQGDERDVIIISIGYGRDSNQKLSMNFGPLNQNGGYKRLNVAITRAKEQVILVGSILPSDFDLSKTASKGVALLKGYIEYAMNALSLVKSDDNSCEIISSLKEELENLGFESDINLGNSEFKIDLAVKDPNNKNNYKLAILLDGRRYFETNSVNDRDRLQIEVLKSRGFIVYRLWSTAYILNKDGELLKIKALLEEESINTPKEDTIDSCVYLKRAHVDTLKIEDLFICYPNEEALVEHIKRQSINKKAKLTKIINSLAPIGFEDLKKALLPIYGKTKLTAITAELIEFDLKQLLSEKIFYKRLGFILKPDDLSIVKFRKHDTLNIKNRSIDQIYIEELENGFLEVISIIKSISIKGLFDIFNRLLGYTKTTDKIQTVYNRVLGMLKDKKYIVYDNETIWLKE